MKLCAMMLLMLTCAMLAFNACAVESPKDGRVLAADSSKAAGRPAIHPDAAQGNADRLHSLLNAQIRARASRQPASAVGSRPTPGGAAGMRAPLGVRSTATVKPGASTRAATAAPMHSMLGGSQVQGAARMDGRAFKTAPGSAINGTQFQARHRKST